MAADGANKLGRTTTAIPGLSLWNIPLHGDSRGWFKESWQRAKMTELGLPDFGPVQNNVSFNASVGTTRGIHAEPWDKWISLATGRIFGAWVDLREGPGFGTVVTAVLDPGTAVFVPRGVGNAFQTLEPDTAYSYLVNDHWSSDAEYCFLNLADETVAIAWPIPLDQAEMSAKDRAHPRLADVTPVPPPRTLIVGAQGQLGRALAKALEGHGHVVLVDRDELDISSPAAIQAWPWRDYDLVINAAAYTAVDVAEGPEGRATAWAINALGPKGLAQAAAEHGITLVHVSTDYVFDGTSTRPYLEDDHFAPLGVYGQSKAAGDLVVGTAPRHYVVRTSWVIGEGRNFVTTMAGLAARGVAPSVVDDQIGRLTFTEDLAAGILHLVRSGAPYGTYNLTGGGEPASWAEVARAVFELEGHDPLRVTDVSTAEYEAGLGRISAPRPAHSVLDLARIEAAGFTPPGWRESLARYLAEQRDHSEN
ncbi:dTDP-4-dehydrorhamnose reductase [Tessaracoccus sp. Y1736]